jgi:hypothetical protein
MGKITINKDAAVASTKALVGADELIIVGPFET